MKIKEKIVAAGDWQYAVKNFSETKASQRVAALKSIDVNKGIYSAEEEAVALELKRKLTCKKINGR